MQKIKMVTLLVTTKNNRNKTLSLLKIFILKIMTHYKKYRSAQFSREKY